ncbi:polyketide cyclase [Haloprofundus marisrubri]|uniref:Polyketide cyclase n=1 Tax=Haloprofundus marisrubri TaxID=1514971 RepID=A0A0W1RD89_9EURY|nr:SRPBCC family protein [Haloprofundus marisrubri]KTG11669.1 polyketide cyclase [Haloprofundus marisrubri]
MHEVTVSRFVRAPPRVVRRVLTPEAVIEYEGSFEVQSVEETDDGPVVVAGSRRFQFALRFETLENGLFYEQAGDAGPFDAMETTVTVDSENEGSQVTMQSAVSLGLPLTSVTDRVAAWKRRGELKRALDALATDVE